MEHRLRLHMHLRAPCAGLFRLSPLVHLFPICPGTIVLRKRRLLRKHGDLVDRLTG